MRTPPRRLLHFRHSTYAAASKDPYDLRAYVSCLTVNVGDLKKHRADLKAQFRHEPLLHDVIWRHLNHTHLTEVSCGRYGLAWGSLLSMATMLFLEENYEQATDMMCRCVFWAESGITNTDQITRRANLEYGGATPGLIGTMEEVAELALLLTPEMLKPIFLSAVALDSQTLAHLRPVGSPLEVWARVEAQLSM